MHSRTITLPIAQLPLGQSSSALMVNKRVAPLARAATRVTPAADHRETNSRLASSDTPEHPVAIIGAGLAGLTAADQLHRQGIPFIMFEAGPKIAGLAASHQDAEGFSYDFGAHFINNRLAQSIGILDDCRPVHHYSESVRFQGKTYSYPFGLLTIPRLLIGGLLSKLFPNHRNDSAAEWFRTRYGAAFANEIALPLLEGWAGVPADQLSHRAGENLPSSLLKTIYLKVAGLLTRRAVCIGYSREQPESADIYHVYPKRGLSMLCEKLAENIREHIHLKSPVEEIIVENGKVVAIVSNGQLHRVSAVISTAPVHILPKIVKGTDILAPLAKFRYRPMIFVNLRFEGRGLLPDAVLWFPEKGEQPYFRLTEATQSMPWLAPEGKTMITVDIGAQLGDAHWTMDEEQLKQHCLRHLRDLIPDAESRYLGGHVLKAACAYPVYHKDYEAERQQLETHGTGIDNLISVGRNGDFAHIMMEDVHYRAVRKTQRLVEQLVAR